MKNKFLSILLLFTVLVLSCNKDEADDILGANSKLSASISGDKATVKPGEAVVITITAESEDYIDYEWQINNTKINNTASSYIFDPPVDGSYKVKVTVSDDSDAVVCETTITVSAPTDIEYTKVKALMGYWVFAYTIINTYTDSYDLCFIENGDTTGEWNLFGNNEYDDLVIASYSTTTSKFSLLDPGTSLDLYFVFTIPGNSASGTYYQINSSGSWSSGYTMVGSRSTELSKPMYAAPSLKNYTMAPVPKNVSETEFNFVPTKELSEGYEAIKRKSR